MTGYVRDSSGAGGWETIVNYFVRTATGAGGWKTITDGWVRVSLGAGGWKRFFQLAVTPSIQFTVTVSTSSSAYPATLTGTNYHWYNATSLTYIFQNSPDGVTWTDIGTHTSISNPAVGGSNTVTRVLTTSDFPAATTYFRFTVTGVNSTYGTSFTSASTAVTVTAPLTPGPVQNLTKTTGNGTSKTISWDAPATGTTPFTYQYNVNSTGWNNVTPSSSNTFQALTLSYGANTVQIRAVNIAGNGTPSSISITIPQITGGPNSTPTSSTEVNISWFSNNQSSYSLSLPGAPGTPFTGTTATSVDISGLTSGSTYTPTLTITSSTSDTTTATGSSFTMPTFGTVSLSGLTTGAAELNTTLGYTLSGWSSGLTYTQQWYRAFSAVTALGTSTTQAVGTAYTSVGQYIYVVVQGYSGASLIGTVTSNSAIIVPMPPTFTLTNNTDGTFTVSTVRVNGSSADYYYYGSWTGPSSTSGTISERLLTSNYTSTTSIAGSYTITLYARKKDPTGTGTTDSIRSTAQSVSVTIVTVPGAPRNLARTLAGTNKTFTWDAPLSDGGSAIIRYEYNVDNLGWFTVTPVATNTSQAVTFTAGSHTFQVRAVNSVGAGSSVSTGTFIIPAINSGPTASSVTSTSATVSWTSSNQNSYSLSVPGAPSTPYTGTTGTSVSLTGLTASTSYTPTLTITSSTSDTATATGTSFNTTAAVPVNTVAPSVTPTSGYINRTTYSCTTGTWTNSPTSYAYQWQYNDGGALYVSISGATTSAYSPPINFFSIGYASPIRCRVTATNSGGSTIAFSNTATVLTPTVPGLVTGHSASSLLSGSTLSWNTTWSAPSSDGGATITSYRVYVQASTSSSGPWTNVTTSISTSSGGPFSGAYTSASPFTTANATTPKTLYGRVSTSTFTWIRVFVAAVNSVGTGSYNMAVG